MTFKIATSDDMNEMCSWTDQQIEITKHNLSNNNYIKLKISMKKILKNSEKSCHLNIEKHDLVQI